MNRNSLGIILILAALALPWMKIPLPDPVPVDPPAPAVEVPQSVRDALSGGFKERKREAALWSGLLFGLARAVQEDGSHPDGPRLKTMVDVERLRDWAVKCPPQAIGGGESIAQAIGPELQRLGDSTEELEKDGRRASLVKLLDGAAFTLEHLSK